MFKILGAALAAGSLLYVPHGATGPPAYAMERHVVITNDTHQAIVEIYLSNVGTQNWQQDILGSDFLTPGSSLIVGIDDRQGQCRFDLKTVLDDGTDLVRRNVDVCGVERYTISYR